jgi:hypothetical protein
MPNPQSTFDQISKLAAEAGPEKTLDFLEHRFRADKDYFKLFEVLKMRCRHGLGLPLVYSEQPDDLTDQQQDELENGLLAACREVGTMLIKNGQLQEGWMYLQPVGDRAMSEKLIQSIEVNEENIDPLIEISVTQGAAPAYGYGLLLNHFGTCNAITTFDTQAARFDKKTQRAMAEHLLRHLYNELCNNVANVIKESEKTTANDSSLAGMLSEHPWLVEGGAHHIDTTHLASVIRISRIVEQAEDLQKAVELADYGLQLHEDFQYPSPAPFENTYPDHKAFYQGLLGIDVDTAIKHFEKKCDTVEPQQHGPVAFESLVDFLVRLERNEQAIEVLTSKVLGKFEPMGIAPGLFDVAKTASELESVRAFYRKEDDLLGFAVGVLKDPANQNQ